MRLASQSTFIDENNELWIPASEYNLLCHLNGNGETEIIGSFKDYQLKNGWVISKTIKHKDNIYFFSALGPDYWVLSLKTKELCHYLYTQDLSFKAISFVKLENCIYIIPRSSKHSVLKLDFESSIAKSVSDPVLVDNNEHVLSFSFLYDGKLYFASRTENNISLFEYDIESQNIRFKGLQELRFVKSIVANEAGVFVLGRSKNSESIILQISYGEFEIEKIFNYNDSVPLNDDLIMFHGFAINENLLFVSSNENSGFIFKTNSNNEYKIDILRGSNRYDLNNYSSQITTKKIYFSSIKNEFLWCYDLENLEDYLVDYELDESELINKILNSERFANIFKENKYLKVETLIRYMGYFRHGEQKENYVGEKIYTKLK